MKKIVLATVIVLCCLLSGCGKGINYDLPEDPILFEQEEFTDPDHPEDGYMSLTYHGRVYVPYGTLGSTINGKNVDQCIGYVYDDTQPDSQQVRVITLQGTEDYLMMYIVDSVMEQPMFYRAIDTRDQAIYTPDYIDSLEYEYWKSH